MKTRTLCFILYTALFVLFFQASKNVVLTILVLKELRIIGVFARLDLRKESKMKMTQQIPFNEFLSWRSQIPRQSQNNLMANQDLCQTSGLTIRKFIGGLDHIVVQKYLYQFQVFVLSNPLVILSTTINRT